MDLVRAVACWRESLTPSRIIIRGPLEGSESTTYGRVSSLHQYVHVNPVNSQQGVKEGSCIIGLETQTWSRLVCPPVSLLGLPFCMHPHNLLSLDSHLGGYSLVSGNNRLWWMHTFRWNVCTILKERKVHIWWKKKRVLVQRPAVLEERVSIQGLTVWIIIAEYCCFLGKQFFCM